MYKDEIVIGGEVSLSMQIDGDANLTLMEDGIEGIVIAYEQHGREPYTGSYEVTPSQDTQIISTKEKVMTDDFVVNSIPSNYGLITWDGSTLTVS